MNKELKKSITLGSDNVVDIINCIDTSIIYLYSQKSRFCLLEMPLYYKTFDNRIARLQLLQDKFKKFHLKFDTDNNIIDNPINTVSKILGG